MTAARCRRLRCFHEVATKIEAQMNAETSPTLGKYGKQICLGRLLRLERELQCGWQLKLSLARSQARCDEFNGVAGLFFETGTALRARGLDWT